MFAKKISIKKIGISLDQARKALPRLLEFLTRNTHWLLVLVLALDFLLAGFVYYRYVRPLFYQREEAMPAAIEINKEVLVKVFDQLELRQQRFQSLLGKDYPNLFEPKP